MSERLRGVAREVFMDALTVCTVSAAVERLLAVEDGVMQVGEQQYALHRFPDVRVIAIGKAGAAMFDAVRPLLDGVEDVRAVVCAPAKPKLLRVGDQFFAGGHPLPNAKSLASARAAVELLRGATEKTLALFLVSGGASAMFETPLSDEVTLDDLLELNRKLVGSGAPIAEMNCVRKHFSAVKGGRLVAAAGPATCVSLLLSDVPPGRLDALASGPTLPDSSTVGDCRWVVEEYLGGASGLPESLARLMDDLPETPKPGDVVFARSQSAVLLDSGHLVEAAAASLRARGFQVEIDCGCDDWDYREAAEYLLAKWERLTEAGEPVCLLSGGEVTVKLPVAPGVGGRNQQWGLYCAGRLQELGLRATVLSAGSDGIDGVSPAAGCVVDETTWNRAATAGFEPEARLAGFDAYPLFAGLGDAVETGPTGNNLRDLRMLLWEPQTQVG